MKWAAFAAPSDRGAEDGGPVGFGQFLQNLKNQGMHPYLWDFPSARRVLINPNRRANPIWYSNIPLPKPFDYFVVFAEMRTGSNFLETNLNAFEGIACYGEAFNPHFVGYPNKRAFLASILRRAPKTRSPLFRRSAGRTGVLAGSGISMTMTRVSLIRA